MQAVILAAGRGTRMEPLSTVTPKPMLPVGDRPLIAHVADAAIEAGSDELIIVVGYKADHIRSYFGDHYGGVPVRYAEQPTAAGTADAVKRASPMLDGRFAVLNGDSLFDTPSLTELFTHEAGVAAHRVDQPGEYGVLSTDHGIATEVVEKPDDPPTNLANAGAYVFPEAALTALDVPESERGEREITDVLSWLIDRMDVAIVETDQWLDVARPADCSGRTSSRYPTRADASRGKWTRRRPSSETLRSRKVRRSSRVRRSADRSSSLATRLSSRTPS